MQRVLFGGKSNMQGNYIGVYMLSKANCFQENDPPRSSTAITKRFSENENVDLK